MEVGAIGQLGSIEVQGTAGYGLNLYFDLDGDGFFSWNADGTFAGLGRDAFALYMGPYGENITIGDSSIFLLTADTGSYTVSELKAKYPDATVGIWIGVTSPDGTQKSATINSVTITAAATGGITAQDFGIVDGVGSAGAALTDDKAFKDVRSFTVEWYDNANTLLMTGNLNMDNEALGLEYSSISMPFDAGFDYAADGFWNTVWATDGMNGEPTRVEFNVTFKNGVTATAENTIAATEKVAVGDSYGGGKVAYILVEGDPGYDANVQHGLIAATNDQSDGTVWSNIYTTDGIEKETYTALDGTEKAYGTGQANTTAIVGQSGCNSGAAYLCDNLDEGGYTDWYLPSPYELNKLYLNRAAIGGFSVGSVYWGSYKFLYNHSPLAWMQEFTDGLMYGTSLADNRSVRAVRTF